MVAILKQVSGPIISTIEVHRVTRKQASHEPRQPIRARTHEQMQVIGEQAPRQARRACLREEEGQPLEEIRLVAVIAKDDAPLDSPCDHVVQQSRSVESSTSRHGPSYTM
jgi:hypothetical protein